MAELKRVGPSLQKSALIASVKSIVTTTCHEKLSCEPALKTGHIKWNDKHKMIIRSKDRGFEGPSVVSAIGLFLSDKHVTKGLPCGAVVLFSDEYYVRKLMSSSGLLGGDVSDPGVIVDFCSELCNMITGGLINRIVIEGYQEILMTAPITNREEIPDGIAFNPDYTEYIEFVFSLWDKHVFTIVLTLSAIFSKEYP